MTLAKKLKRQFYTVEEYLALERASEERHEYLDGEIHAMAGESPEHSDISVNLASELRAQLKDTLCRVVSPNTKIRSGHPIQQKRQPKGLFSYADASVVCGTRQFHDKYQDILLNPKVIFEVLSDSTESFDRGEKFWRYRAHIATLTDYVLISQTRPLVEHYRRSANDEWVLTTVTGLDGVLKLDSINCRLSLAELYYGVTFPESKKIKAKLKTKKGKKQKGAKKG
jgi:Uma2 family endonuclease